MTSLYDQYNKLKKKKGFPHLCYAEWHITDKCNLRCYFCNQSYLRSEEIHELPLGVILNALDGMKRMGLSHIRLSGGGEPTAHPGFTDIIKYLRDNNISLENLTTNGLLCDNKMVDILLAVNWQTVLISLCASERRDWIKITGGTAVDYDTICSNVEYLINEKRSRRLKNPTVRLMFGIDGRTYLKLNHAYELASRLNVDEVIFKTYNLVKYPLAVRKNKDRIVSTLRAIYEDNRRTRRIGRIFLQLSALQLNAPIVEGGVSEPDAGIADSCIMDDEAACWMPWYGTLIQANGDVRTCCEGWPSFPVLGNIVTQSIEDIWHGDKYITLRRSFEEALFGMGTSSADGYNISERCRPAGDPDRGCAVKIGWEKVKQAHSSRAHRRTVS